MKQSNIVYMVSNGKKNRCEETYIGETKLPINTCTNIGDPAHQESKASIYSHLNATQLSFGDKDIVILANEHKWFERGVKEAKQGKPSLNKGGGLSHNLPKAYDAAIKKITKRLL